MINTAAIFFAALAAGMFNSISGGGTLITFPALIWIGVDPVVANATNTVALWPGTIATLIARRHEMRGNALPFLVLGIPSISGGLIGAIVLIHTPAHVFRIVAPGLMFVASLILGAQELLNRNAQRFSLESGAGGEPSLRGWILLAAVLFGVAVYGGYFGAGIGILILAILGAAGLTDIHRMIALRVFCSMCVNGVAAVYFVLFSTIDWPAAVTMTVAQVLGNWLGTCLSRNINAIVLRRSIVAFGLAMAGVLLGTT
jgi:uncharacterized membrane protein YfcA